MGMAYRLRWVAMGQAALGGLALSSGLAQPASRLPVPLVFLADIEASIEQDIRYATANNFTGRPVPGYAAAECVLLRSVAMALALVQWDLASQGYGLKVYDCYRPERAVHSFMAWAREGADDEVTRRFHPRVSKTALVGRGYIGSTSLHSQGRAVDVTLVRLPRVPAPAVVQGRKYGGCNATKSERAPDNSVDLGTDFDCFDAASHVASKDVGEEQRRARQLLASAMERRGFSAYALEWWHFNHPSREADRRAFDVAIPVRPRQG